MSASPQRSQAGKFSPRPVDALSNALCACIIAYCVLSFVAGQAGLLAYGDTKADIRRMESQLEAFSLENAALQDSRDALLKDRDRITREARAIGYVRADEKIIFLSNIDTAMVAAKPGRVEPVRSGRSSGLPDTVLKILSALTGISVLLATLLMGYAPVRGKSTVKEGRPSVAEAPGALGTMANR